MTMAAQIALVLFALIAPGAAALMGWLHYAIPKWTGSDIKPPWTYVLGVGGGILAPFALWVVAYRIIYGRPTIDAFWTLLALTGICACSGLAVMVCYDRDHKRALASKAAKGERMMDDDRAE